MAGTDINRQASVPEINAAGLMVKGPLSIFFDKRLLASTIIRPGLIWVFP